MLTNDQKQPETTQHDNIGSGFLQSNGAIMLIVLICIMLVIVLAKRITKQEEKYTVPKQLVLIGFGAVQKALVTLMLLKEPRILKASRLLIIEPLDLDNSESFKQLNAFRYQQGVIPAQHLKMAITKGNYKQTFEQYIKDALVVDLAVRLGTKDIIRECSNFNSLYINTAIDIWPEDQTKPYQSIYDIKQQIVRDIQCSRTTILNFGANPGLVSHFVKASLTQLASSSSNPQLSVYIKNNQYNEVARALNLTLIQISERDTQEQYQKELSQITTCKSTLREREQQISVCKMINTWSVMGFLDEAYDKCQISFGTHESGRLPQLISSTPLKGLTSSLQESQRLRDESPHLPVEEAMRDFSPVIKTQYRQELQSNVISVLGLTDQDYLESTGQIVLNKVGVDMMTRSFEPVGGSLIGFNIPHAECYSLVEFLRVGNTYRPGSHYSYLPCNGCYQITRYAHSIDRFTLNKVNESTQWYEEDCIDKQVLRNDQIKDGYDSLGALMYFRIQDNSGTYKLKALWSGTILSSKEAKDLGDEVNATTIQVAISTLAAITWMLMPNNKKRGLLEPEALPTDYIMNYCKPYLGSVLINYDCSSRYQPQSDQYLDLVVSK